MPTSIMCRKFESHASNATGTSVSLKNNLTDMTFHAYENHPIYETNKEAVDQTDAENRSDLFRVHVLRGRGLIERDYLTPKIPG